MHITFIRPNMINERQSDAMEPLAFAILEGLTPEDVDLTLYDDRIEEIDYNKKTDLVAISVETFAAKRAYAIAAEYRRRGVLVVMGGFHATFLPEEILEHADSVVIGDAEGVWKQVVNDARLGKLARKYQKLVDNIDEVVFSRTIFKDKKFNKMIPVQYSRGCKFDCDFCSINAFYDNRLMQRPVRKVIVEIEAIDRKFFFITDDNIFLNKIKAREFFTALIPLKIHWACQVSVDVARDDELLSLMRKSGCIAAIVGFESLETANLKLMNKDINIRNDYELIVKKFEDNGIMIFGTFVFGYDHDTVDVFKKTLDFAIESKLFIAQFNPLMPMPGTRLYKRLEKEKRLIYDKWWLDPHYKWGDSMYVPVKMSPEELAQGCQDIRLKFNTYSSIFKRALNPKNNCRSIWHLFWFLAANIITRHEIQRKMGRVLGT